MLEREGRTLERRESKEGRNLVLRTLHPFVLNVYFITWLKEAAVNMKWKPYLSATHAPTHQLWIARDLALLPTLDATFGIIPTLVPPFQKTVEFSAGAKVALRERGWKRQGRLRRRRCTIYLVNGGQVCTDISSKELLARFCEYHST